MVRIYEQISLLGLQFIIISILKVRFYVYIDQSLSPHEILPIYVVTCNLYRHRKDIDKNWFTNRAVEEWNKLSKLVVSAGTVDTFKKRLDISMDEENRW